MFKSDNSSGNSFISDKNKSQPETIIGASVKVEGNFRGDGNLIIEGEVKGSIKTKHDVHIGEKAIVNATIECVNAFIAGQVNGNISVKQKVELAASARVTGDLITPSVKINEGAKLNGLVKMDEPNTTPQTTTEEEDSDEASKKAKKK